MSRPRLLDLFCCAGGAAMGYHRAGFDVTGVDHVEQPRYPFAFVKADALAYLAEHGSEYDVIHASPPCQRYSAASEIHDTSSRHPDLVGPARDLLIASGKPWVMENVERAPMEGAIVLCGSMFGLGVKRHRLFELSLMMLAPPCGSHTLWYAGVHGGRCVGRQRITRTTSGRTQTWDKFDDELATARKAMGIDWMDLDELSQAIPPAYTEFLGKQLLRCF